MYVCPHCSSKSIGAWRKFNATPWFPARCGVCGGESMASGWGRSIAALGAEVLMWASIVFALVMGSVYGLLPSSYRDVGTLGAGESPLSPRRDRCRLDQSSSSRGLGLRHRDSRRGCPSLCASDPMIESSIRKRFAAVDVPSRTAASGPRLPSALCRGCLPKLAA